MDHGRERRIVVSALMLVGAVTLGLTLGAATSTEGATKALAVPALGLQTLLTVGALPRREEGVELRPGLQLLAMHHLIASLPMALVGIAIGIHEPLGFGLFMIAAAPPAALIPAYADVAEVPGRDLLVFVLLAYGVALVLTPALTYLAAGKVVGVGTIALTLTGGLIAPAILARVLHTQVVRIPQRVRRAIVSCTVVVICFGLGGGFRDGLDDASVTVFALVLVMAALAIRSFGGIWVAGRVAPAALREDAPFAVAFKNVALAAAVGGSLLGPVAALPGLLGFPVEILAFLWLARRHARAEAVV
jgi:hypothetical protein